MSNNTLKQLAGELFHAYDIRISSDLLTKAAAERLLRAQIRYIRGCLRTNIVLLARDGRLTGPRFMEQAIAAFSSCGFTVMVIPVPVSTCQFYYACRQYPLAAGIMFSASHNPGIYTGQKMIQPGCLPIAMGIGPSGGLSQVKDFFLNDAGSDFGVVDTAGEILCVNCMDGYVDECLDLSGVKPGGLKGISLVVDFLCGAAGYEILRGLQKAGVNAAVRNLVPDGFFPAGAPNPIIKKNIQPSLDILAGGGYDFGLFFDGDGDRLDIFLADGYEIPPSLTLAFLSDVIRDSFKENLHKGVSAGFPIGFDAKASPSVYGVVAEKGMKPVLIPNGHSKVKGVMLEHGLLAASEESSHYYFRLPCGEKTAPSESTLFVCLLFLRVWNERRKEFSDLVERRRREYRNREWGYRFESVEAQNKALEAVAAELTGLGFVPITTMADGKPLGGTVFRKGIRSERGCALSPDWIQVSQRVSQTEPNLARWEAAAALDEEGDKIVELINSVVEQYSKFQYIG